MHRMSRAWRGGGIGDHRLTLYGALAYALNQAERPARRRTDPDLSHLALFSRNRDFRALYQVLCLGIDRAPVHSHVGASLPGAAGRP